VALDIACGSGRHAVFLAESGLQVRAVDKDCEAIKALRTTSKRRGLSIAAEALDLEANGVDLGAEAYDAIVVVHYLHRPLFPALVRALRPGGLLLYETFTMKQAQRGKPTNPAFLLRPGELPRLVRPLEVLRRREGDFEGRWVAAVAARKLR
jgi:2-polyprenyl-3-methyl-5-hydroxy-6-metoxy-1,4-benzoquinol methylase